MKFFKPKDFEYFKGAINYNLKSDQLAAIANAKLASKSIEELIEYFKPQIYRYLKHEGTIVHNTSINGEVFNQGWSTARTYGDTHQALLINIEPIKKPGTLVDWDSLRRACNTLEELAVWLKPYYKEER